jgi:hypothetical protein
MLGTVLKRWNWLEDGLIPLAATLMYAAWSYPLFALFIRNQLTGVRNPGFSFWLCLGILLGGAIAGRMASQNRMGAVIVVVGGLAAIVISLLLTMPAEAEGIGSWFADVAKQVAQGSAQEVVPVPIIVVLCVTLLWWRGARVVSAEHEEIMGAFVVGVVAFVGLLILATIKPSVPSGTSGSMTSVLGPMAFLISVPAALALAAFSRVLGERAITLSQIAAVVGLLFLGAVLPSGPSSQALVGWILLFLASGLVTLALFGVLSTLRDQQRRIGVRLRIDRYWVMTMLTVVVGVLIVGLLVGQILAPATVLWALGWIRPIWTLLVQIFLLIVYAFAYLFFSLIEPLLAAIENRPQRPNPQPQFSPVEPGDLSQVPQGTPLQIPPIVGEIVLVALGLGVIALIAWIFYRAVQKGKREGVLTQDNILETRETILSVDLLRSQLQDVLGALRRPRSPPPFVDPGQVGDPRRVIRELYQKILAQAGQLGAPRGKDETPSAYQRTLSYLCSEEQASLETLTLAYVIARYSLSPPTQEQVQSAQEAFARVDAALQARARRLEI